MGRGKPSSLKTEIYDSILKDIIEGNYKQNEIINEKQLIEKYGVSKSPIRDALIELCSEGVLISHPRYGYEVVRINEKEIRDIVNFRIMIETGCLRDAASIMTRADIRERGVHPLQSAITVMRTPPSWSTGTTTAGSTSSCFPTAGMSTATVCCKKALES